MPALAAVLRSSPRSPQLSTHAAAALDLGYTKIVLGSPLYERELSSVLDLLPPRAVAALALFSPLPATVKPGRPCPFVLGDAGSVREAVEAGRRSIEWADRLEGRLVLIPRAPLDPRYAEAFRRLPRRQRATGLALPSPEDLERVVKDRACEADRALDSYRRALDPLLHTAADYGVRLALRPSSSLSAAPNADEANALLQEFAGAPLVLWSDTAHVALTAALSGASVGSESFQSPWRNDDAPTAGVTLRDLNADACACQPGSGHLDWRYLTKELAGLELWAVDPAGEVDTVLGGVRDLLETLEESSATDPLGLGET